MGQETTTTPVRIKRFLGLNTKLADTDVHLWESTGLQNVNITEGGVEQRRGSTKLNAVAFKDKTDTDAKAIVGLYSTNMGGTIYQVGIGGDAFKQLSAGAWVDKTGAVTLTDDADALASFATFYDSGAANEIIIACKEGDAPIKWTGTGNAAALGGAPPTNFKWPIVHKNKLWVVVDDFVYFSGLRDGESWDLVNDVVRFSGNGENITGLGIFSDRVIVFKPSSIHAISGSSERDMYTETIVTGDGCASGYSIQEVESRRYGNILVFLSSEGTIKGFNGSKNLLLLGDPAKPLYDTMNRSRLNKCVSMNYEGLNQYWLSMSLGSDSTHSQMMVYDYFNDRFTDEETGRPLSSNLYHIGINANAMAIFENSSNVMIPVTGDYNGFALRQDYGLVDEDSILITSKWQTGKMHFGSPSHVKLLTDMAIETTQSSVTTMSVTATTASTAGAAAVIITTAGGMWGFLVWGTGNWSAPITKYTRCYMTPNTGERAVSGRYILTQMSHSTANEAMDVEELIIGVSDLGLQPEYTE